MSDVSSDRAESGGSAINDGLGSNIEGSATSRSRRKSKRATEGASRASSRSAKARYRGTTRGLDTEGDAPEDEDEVQREHDQCADEEEGEDGDEGDDQSGPDEGQGNDDDDEEGVDAEDVDENGSAKSDSSPHPATAARSATVAGKARSTTAKRKRSVSKDTQQVSSNRKGRPSRSTRWTPRRRTASDASLQSVSQDVDEVPEAIAAPNSNQSAEREGREGSALSEATSVSMPVVKRRRGRPPRPRNPDGSIVPATPSRASGRESKASSSATPVDKNPPVEEEELAEVETDPVGEAKISHDGDLLGGRQFKVPSFLIPDRHPTRKYMFAPDVAKCVGQRDGFTLFMKYPQLTRLWTTEAQREYLTSQGLLSSHLKSRNITLVTARTIFRHFGHWLLKETHVPHAVVIRKGKPIRDDYFVGNQVYESPPESERSANEDEGETISTASAPRASARSMSNAPKPDIGGAATGPSKTIPILNEFAVARGLPQLSMIGRSVSGTGAPGLAISAANQGVEWMYHAALSAAEYNSRLSTFRKNGMQRFLDPHTGIHLVAADTQPRRIGIQLQRAKDYAIAGRIEFPDIPAEDGVSRSDAGWTAMNADCTKSLYPLALYPGQQEDTIPIHRERFRPTVPPGYPVVPIPTHTYNTGASSASFAVYNEVSTVVTSILHDQAAALAEKYRSSHDAPFSGSPGHLQAMSLNLAGLSGTGRPAVATGSSTPRPSREPVVSRIVLYCAGTSYTGDPCRRMVTAQGEYCGYHRDQERKKKAFEKEMRVRSSRPAGPGDPDRPPSICRVCQKQIQLVVTSEMTEVGAEVLTSNELGVICSRCTKGYHAACAELDTPQLRSRATTYEWHCSSCRQCVVCHSAGREESILVCDHCERRFHSDCVHPPLSVPPQGRWLCPLCSYCVSCGVRGQIAPSRSKKCQNGSEGEVLGANDSSQGEIDSDGDGLDPSIERLVHVIDSDVYIGTFCESCKASLDANEYCPMCLRATAPGSSHTVICQSCSRPVHADTSRCDPELTNPRVRQLLSTPEHGAVDSDNTRSRYVCPCCSPDLRVPNSQHYAAGSHFARFGERKVFVPGPVRRGDFVFIRGRGVVRIDVLGRPLRTVLAYPKHLFGNPSSPSRQNSGASSPSIMRGGFGRARDAGSSIGGSSLGGDGISESGSGVDSRTGESGRAGGSASPSPEEQKLTADTESGQRLSEPPGDDSNEKMP